MLQSSRWVLSSILMSIGNLAAQTAVQPGILAEKTRMSFALPDKKPEPSIACPGATQAKANDKHFLPGFLKDLTLTSFGYSLEPTGPGFEAPFSISSNPFNAPGLECPACGSRPEADHLRFSLPPFGAQVMKKLAADRIELFSSYGGIDGWSANGLTIRVSGDRFAPYRSPAAFNDEWLSELTVGARVSLDPGGHLWLGSEFRSVWNQGPAGPGETAHWNTFIVSATFEFGH